MLATVRNAAVRAWQRLTTRRSPHWPAIRSTHLKANPWCRVCGGVESLEVHHIVPFHLHPELELTPANLLTLCEAKGFNCHLKRGHLGDWRNFNPQIRAEANHKMGH